MKATLIDANKNLVRDTDVFTGRSATLSLEGRTEINFYFAIPAATKEAAQKSGILFWSQADYAAATELTVENATYEVAMKYYESNSRWGAACPRGFATKEYEETIYACAYLVDSEGNYHYSGVIAYSAEQYCANQINKGAVETDMCKALTIYGEAAQAYFSV